MELWVPDGGLGTDTGLDSVFKFRVPGMSSGPWHEGVSPRWRCGS